MNKLFVSSLMQNSEEGSKKNRRAILDSDEEDIGLPHEHAGRKEDASNGAAMLLESAETSKVRVEAKKKKKVEAEDIEKLSYDLINQMREYYKRDLEHNKQNKPSFEKIEHVEEVCSKIIKKDWQEILVKMGILNELKIWLEPLADKSLPSPKIKQHILDLLYTMRVTKNDLLDCGIGKIVHFYAKNPKESLKIRKLAHKIMNRWKQRIIREEVGE